MRRGLTLVEVVMAASILAIAVLAMGMFQSAVMKANQREKDRAVAVQKAVQIMEEIKSYNVTRGPNGNNTVDALSDGANYNFMLSIDPQLSSPTQALSGNTPFNAGFKFVRQVQVNTLPNDPNGRRVTVVVFYGDGSSTANPKSGFGPLATVTNIVRTDAIKVPPAQVYDLYVIAVENSSGGRDAFTQMLQGTINSLKILNPGLEFRLHMIRQMGYGRDPYYKAAFNTPGDILSYGYDPTMLNMPANIAAQITATGVPTNLTYSEATPYDTQTAYSLADAFNHDMRYPEELAKYSAVSQNPRAQELTYRLFLDQMAQGLIKNAIIINTHEETIPIVPLRNYSDPARVPQESNATDRQNLFGVNLNTGAGSLADSSRVRLVTHPVQMGVDTTNDNNTDFSDFGSHDISLRVFPFLSSNVTTDPTDPEVHNALIVIKGMAHNDLVHWFGGNKGNDTVGQVEVDAMIDSGSQPAYTGPSCTSNSSYAWDRLYPCKKKELHNGASAGNSYDSMVWYAGDTDRDKYCAGIHYGSDPGFGAANGYGPDDIIIQLQNIPYTHPFYTKTTYVSSFLYTGNVVTSSGLPTGTTLQGYNYFPDPFLPTLDWGYYGSEPRNTTRFMVRLRCQNPDLLTVVTTLGSDVNLNHHKYPNLSQTYVWVGQPVPASEQIQVMGDPRFEPDYNTRKNQNYNRYWADFTGGAYPMNSTSTPSGSGYSWGGGWAAWGGTWPFNPSTYPATENGWHYGGNGVQEVEDVPRFFEFMRQGLLGGNSMYVSPLGFSFWAGDEGGLRGSVPATAGNAWFAKPWIGELFPDGDWSTWRATGNLSTSTYSLKTFDNLPSWIPGGGANQAYASWWIADMGCVAFANGGTAGDGSNWFTHFYEGPNTSPINAHGNYMSSALNMDLDSTLTVERPYRLDATNMNPPSDYQSSWFAGTRTKLEWGLLSGAHGYYDYQNGEESCAPWVMRRGGQSAYFCNASAHWSDYSGSTLLARLALGMGLQGMFDMATTKFADGSNKGSQQPKLPPQIQITSPAGSAEINSNQTITWQMNYVRWDGQNYSDQYNSYAGNLPECYNLIFSADGTHWYYADHPTVAATRGVYDPAYGFDKNGNSVPGYGSNSHNKWTQNGLARGSYQLMLECFRDGGPGYWNTHYSFHQIPVSLVN